MSVYLPIAEMPVSIPLFLALGAVVGMLSGLFGVGGGFLMTPLMIFLGIPPAVAVGTSAAHIVATSVSGAVTQYQRDKVDVRMGLVLLAGGVIGTAIGVETVRMLRRAGVFDVVVSLSYVTFLGSVGTLMMIESVRSWRESRKAGGAPRRRVGQHSAIEGLPFKIRFHRSKLYISVIPPAIIGMFVGFLASVMGVGGGFVIVPAMIYLLRMPTSVVVGTSQFQIVFVAALATILHALQNKSVDIVLAALLIVGGVIGTQIGAGAGRDLRGEQLRFLLAALVLVVAARMSVDLVTTPAELFNFGAASGAS
ncbi:MAG: sulfite exporter TauE/SafE family protein [Hyphomicrobium sp.]